MQTLKAIAIRRSFEQLARRIESRYRLSTPRGQLGLAQGAARAKPPRKARLRRRSVRMPAPLWKALDAAAAHAGVTVSAVLTALVQDLEERQQLAGAIRRLHETDLLHGLASRSA